MLKQLPQKQEEAIKEIMLGFSDTYSLLESKEKIVTNASLRKINMNNRELRISNLTNNFDSKMGQTMTLKLNENQLLKILMKHHLIDDAFSKKIHSKTLNNISIFIECFIYVRTLYNNKSKLKTTQIFSLNINKHINEEKMFLDIEDIKGSNVSNNRNIKLLKESELLFRSKIEEFIIKDF